MRFLDKVLKQDSESYSVPKRVQDLIPIKRIWNDGVFLVGNRYPPDIERVPKRFAIVRAKEHMIRTSDYLICYDRGLVGKTREYVALARQRQKMGKMQIENLYIRQIEKF